MFGILLILIFCRPFISSLAFPEENFIYSVLLLGSLALWIALKKSPLKQNNFPAYPLLLFCLALFFSFIFSLNRTNSLSELYKYISGISLFLVVLSLNGKGKLYVLRAVILSGLIISILALYQYLFGFRHVLNYLNHSNLASDFAREYIARRRVFFPFVTPNTLGGYLAMTIPLAFAFRFKTFILIPLCIALLLTKSLGALLSIFCGLSIYYLIGKKFKGRKIIVLLGALGIIALVFIMRSNVQKQYTQPLFSTTMRLSYWKDTLALISARPFLGIGPGNFNLMQSRYAHNSYLQLWAETGIIGLFSFLWFIIAFLKSSFKNTGGSKYHSSLIAACCVFLIHNFVDFSFFLPEISLIWWVILSLTGSEKLDK